MQSRPRSQGPSYHAVSPAADYSPPPPPPSLPPSSNAAAVSRPYGPASVKRLIVACDGTWLDSDNGLRNGQIQLPSNVTHVARAIKAESSEGIPQIVYYQAGVGTEGGPLSRAAGAAIAEGLSSNIREAYSFLAANYSRGDEIFLFGFSRGAFTARSIAGLIDGVGLLTKSGIKNLGVIFKDFENRGSPGYASRYPDLPFPDKPDANDARYARELQRLGMTRLDVPVKAIGVWDTVGSLGIPRVAWLERLGLQRRAVKEYTFYDTSLGDCVENAFQALALDERRAPFSPTLWEKKDARNRTNLRQVWFPGVHSNVGGGYADMGLSNISLAWMMAQMRPLLDFDRDCIVQQAGYNRAYYAESGQAPRPWSLGEIYNSLAGLYAVAGSRTRTPGAYSRVTPDGRATDRPLRQTYEYVHASVRARIELDGPGESDVGRYEPRTLADYNLRTTGAGPGENRPLAVWESRTTKKKTGAPRRTLPEAPLWDEELRLLGLSPEAERVVFGAAGKGWQRW